MSSVREIRERINSIQNTMKITNAMYLISSTKLNSARRELKKTEPYFFALQSMLQRVIRHMPDDFEHPYLREDAPESTQRRAIICVTADKGLAGAYNHDILTLTMNKLRPDQNDMLFVIGEVGRQYFVSHKVNIDETFRYTAQNPTLERARIIASRMLTLFEEKKVDEIFIIYTQMINSMQNAAQIQQLLPLRKLDASIFLRPQDLSGVPTEEFLMEPGPGPLLDNIVPDYLAGFIYSALVESYTSEHNARMQAMDSANKSGEDLLRRLKIQYNRERQARITQDITEAAAGARARRAQLIARQRRREQMDTGEADDRIGCRK